MPWFECYDHEFCSKCVSSDVISNNFGHWKYQDISANQNDPCPLVRQNTFFGAFHKDKVILHINHNHALLNGRAKGGIDDYVLKINRYLNVNIIPLTIKSNTDQRLPTEYFENVIMMTKNYFSFSINSPNPDSPGNVLSTDTFYINKDGTLGNINTSPSGNFVRFWNSNTSASISFQYTGNALKVRHHTTTVCHPLNFKAVTRMRFNMFATKLLTENGHLGVRCSVNAEKTKLTAHEFFYQACDIEVIGMAWDSTQGYGNVINAYSQRPSSRSIMSQINPAVQFDSLMAPIFWKNYNPYKYTLLNEDGSANNNFYTMWQPSDGYLVWLVKSLKDTFVDFARWMERNNAFKYYSIPPKEDNNVYECSATKAKITDEVSIPSTNYPENTNWFAVTFNWYMMYKDNTQYRYFFEGWRNAPDGNDDIIYTPCYTTVEVANLRPIHHHSTLHHLTLELQNCDINPANEDAMALYTTFVKELN